MRDLITIAELTLREARRRKIVWVALGLGVLFVLLYATGFYFIVQEVRHYSRGRDLVLDTGFNFVVVAAYYVISFLGVVLSVLISVGALAGEVQTHTIQALASKPLQRRVIVLGKWLGLTMMMTLYLIFLSAGVTLATWLIAGYVPPRVAQATALIVFQAIIMLSLSILGGTRLSTVTNGVAAFMLYGVAFIGGWIEQIGAMAHNATAVDIGILSSLLAPSEAMWKMAAYALHPAFIRALGVSPFVSVSAPSPAMLAYAVAYTVAVVWLAVRSFDRRDL
jgi:ABC-type transport system involved in multi-copper enzyme maturation permease subunit